MNILILASALIFAFAISVGIKRYDKENQKAKDDFWERERQSNFVRKKSLDNLDYITIPDEFYEFEYNLPDSKAVDAFDSIKHLRDCKIVNFSGLTNTDLKLEYGTANLSVLSEYDYNYTIMSRSLQILAETLYTDKKTDNAKAILLFLIETGTDMKSTFKTLCDIYCEESDANGIDFLLAKANSLSSLMKSAIIEYISDKKSSLTD